MLPLLQNPYPSPPHPIYPKTQIYQTFLFTFLLRLNTSNVLYSILTQLRRCYRWWMGFLPPSLSLKLNPQPTFSFLRPRHSFVFVQGRESGGSTLGFLKLWKKCSKVNLWILPSSFSFVWAMVAVGWSRSDGLLDVAGLRGFMWRWGCVEEWMWLCRGSDVVVGVNCNICH